MRGRLNAHLSTHSIADCPQAEACVCLLPGIKQLLADKGYDLFEPQP